MQNPAPSRGLPLALKIGYLAWMSVWIPVYWIFIGPQNFLWLCDLANLILLFGLLLESSLIVSSQTVGVLLVQILWTVDFFSSVLTGSHLIGGTQYMFDNEVSLWLRAMSLFHLVLPPLLLFAVYRLGYDERGWKLQTLIMWLVLPVTFLWTAPELNINWLDSPFGQPQTWMSPTAFFFVMMLAYPSILFFPTHAVLHRCMSSRS